jgi:putative ABC transport system permease protein
MPVRHLSLGSGDFLPEDAQSGESVCVLGATVCQELFGSASPLGEFVRVGNRRFRVCGVLATGGMSVGTDLDEIVVLPLEASMALFDSAGLFRILVEARSRDAITAAVADCERILRERHRGELDCTVITQDVVVSAFDGILGALTAAVAGIASISLLVAGILIMNVMVVAVTQRRAEVGLLKALGAERATIRRAFLGEALLLSLAGCALGLLLGDFGSRAVAHSFPALTGGVPGWAAFAAVLVAAGSGLLFGVMPAARAARLDPVLALARR